MVECTEEVSLYSVLDSIWLQFSNIPSLFSPSDEVGALVLDIGSYTARAGYAGEDTPKVRDLIAEGNF